MVLLAVLIDSDVTRVALPAVAGAVGIIAVAVVTVRLSIGERAHQDQLRRAEERARRAVLAVAVAAVAGAVVLGGLHHAPTPCPYNGAAVAAVPAAASHAAGPHPAASHAAHSHTVLHAAGRLAVTT